VQLHQGREEDVRCCHAGQGKRRQQQEGDVAAGCGTTTKAGDDGE
jgi:hypothetical protein